MAVQVQALSLDALGSTRVSALYLWGAEGLEYIGITHGSRGNDIVRSGPTIRALEHELLSDDPYVCEEMGLEFFQNAEGSSCLGATADCGLLEIRYMAGFRGVILTTDSVGEGCNRCDAAALETHLEEAMLADNLDVDGNGETDALSDGLMVIRYLAGFRDETLFAGAVAGDCTRCTAAEIEAFIEFFLPLGP